jgi:hypothetical protein
MVTPVPVEDTFQLTTVFEHSATFECCHMNSSSMKALLLRATTSLYFHPHWLRYRDVIDGAPDWFISGIGIYITVVCLAGIVGNIAVISVFSEVSFRVDLPNNVEMDVNAKIASSLSPV